jgi:alpha-glucoside transport system permease protein
MTFGESVAVEAPPRTTSERITRMLTKAPIHIGLAIVGLIWLLPTVGLLITSFRPASEILSTGWWEIFAGRLSFTLDNYQQVLGSQGMLNSFINSVIITVPATILPVFFCALAAYGFAWVDFPFRDSLFLIVVGLLLVPIQMVLIPLVQLFSSMGVYGQFTGLWIAHTAFALPFGIFLLRNFFITLPRDLIEAAKIDGASTWNIFRTVVMPLSVPALASFAIFQFLWVWNDLLMALVFAPRPNGLPMTTQVQNLLGTFATEWHLLAAASFLIMVVPLIVFFSLQRYFVQGLLAGSVK